VVSYGLHNPAADWQATDWQPNHAGGMNFTLACEGGAEVLGRVMLRVPGVYNVQNALAALIVADHLGVPLADTLAALATFAGADRRFDLRGEAGGVTVIDDYAHHPTAIRATLEAARIRYPKAGIWAVWQPHTYSRLRALFDAFAAAFQPEHADHVLITDVYAAREQPGEGPDVPDLIGQMAHPDVRYTPGFDDALDALAAGVRPGDVVIILSAGDAPQIGESLLAKLG
jgi:UDP-N-acetylmuramate--alanine ligase